MVNTGLEYNFWQFMTRLVINKFETDWNPTLTFGILSWKCIWICLLMFSEMVTILSREIWVKFIPRPAHTFARDWLTQDSVACGRAWNSLDTCRADSTLIGHYIDHSWYTPTKLRHRYGIILHPWNKQWSKEVERSATRQLLCYWRVRPLTAIMRYVMFITCKWKLGKV